ncbi:hypothetical protein BDK51DRAFT_37412 [Blyttiomyces helicus]|uniref:Uncharacterized protein n=1 Tax=Blyttiomyces helicus TaxID=388810 RepID=A0A4P9VXZ6_9FUNG|nr:hypothetical protein BDK51DRAFT_37412 [Blyttiomyces helicus]|eukprot:RKO84641.1 hypothetical protein BDK51DRAFT_37412 [Blyttiomyces helicus]
MSSTTVPAVSETGTSNSQRTRAANGANGTSADAQFQSADSRIAASRIERRSGWAVWAWVLKATARPPVHGQTKFAAVTSSTNVDKCSFQNKTSETNPSTDFTFSTTRRPSRCCFLLTIDCAERISTPHPLIVLLLKMPHSQPTSTDMFLDLLSDHAATFHELEREDAPYLAFPPTDTVDSLMTAFKTPTNFTPSSPGVPAPLLTSSLLLHSALPRSFDFPRQSYDSPNQALLASPSTACESPMPPFATPSTAYASPAPSYMNSPAIPYAYDTPLTTLRSRSRYGKGRQIEMIRMASAALSVSLLLNRLAVFFFRYEYGVFLRGEEGGEVQPTVRNTEA